jgi:hypothetical protein
MTAKVERVPGRIAFNAVMRGDARHRHHRLWVGLQQWLEQRSHNPDFGTARRLGGI